jgi:hypothetical protein
VTVAAIGPVFAQDVPDPQEEPQAPPEQVEPSDPELEPAPPPVDEAEDEAEGEVEDETEDEEEGEEDEEEGFERPFAVTLEYAIYSDYVFRGINFSEYEEEGREKLNHQLDFSLDVDIAALFGQEAETYGWFTFNAWFEWYAAQKQLDPNQGGQNLQEVDYSLSWYYDVEPLATAVTVGYSFYTIPNWNSYNTGEWWFTLEHNDAWMWKWLWPENEDGILNPTLNFAHDLDLTPGAIWIDVGISHEFEVIENLTVTPGFTLGIDHRYLDPVLETEEPGSTGLAVLQYGLNVSYDLSTALEIPEEAGTVAVSGFLFFNDVVGHAKDRALIEDELFGGMSVAWSW